MEVRRSDQQRASESVIAGTTLTAQQFYQHDPLLVLLKDKWRLHNLWIIAGVLLFPGAAFLVWWLWLEYVLASKEHFWVLGDTLGALLQTFIIFPLLFLIYLLVPSSVAGLFNTLRANGVIGECRKDQPGSQSYEHFVQQLLTWTDRSWWTATAVVVVLLYLLYRFLEVEPYISIPAPLWLRVAALLIYVPLMYATFMSVIRLVFALVFINRLFTLFRIHVKPLHPDGSGGLSILRHILWISIAIMFWDALLLSTAFLSSNMRLFSPLEIVLLSAIYVTLTPSLLIGWLGLPHWVMVKARDEALLPLANEFQQAFMQAMSSINDDANSIKAGTDRLAEIKRRYDLIRDTFPTWPLEIQELGRVLATVSLPALLPLLLPLIPFLITFVGHILSLP